MWIRKLSNISIPRLTLIIHRTPQYLSTAHLCSIAQVFCIRRRNIRNVPSTSSHLILRVSLTPFCPSANASECFQPPNNIRIIKKSSCNIGKVTVATSNAQQYHPHREHELHLSLTGSPMRVCSPIAPIVFSLLAMRDLVGVQSKIPVQRNAIPLF